MSLKLEGVFIDVSIRMEYIGSMLYIPGIDIVIICSLVIDGTLDFFSEKRIIRSSKHKAGHIMT